MHAKLADLGFRLSRNGLPDNRKLYRLHLLMEREGGQTSWEKSQLVTLAEALEAGRQYAGGVRDLDIRADTVAVDKYFADLKKWGRR